MPFRQPVPSREYPPEVRPVLGARYVTVCAVFGERSARYEHGYLLWSDEPFTEAIVAREMTSLGFHTTDIGPSRTEEQPWAATITSGPPQAEQTYLGIFHSGDCATIRWIGLWSHHYGKVVHDKPEHGWHTAHAIQVLYEQRDLYELPRDNVVILTTRQATGLAIIAGRRLPTAAELAASIRIAEEAEWSDQQLWQRFHDHRAALFAAHVHRLRADGSRLADTPPPRQPVSSYDDRKQVVAGIAPLRVKLGETFPLLRFLVGDFRDRDAGLGFPAEGSYTVYTNRLDVITADGDTVELTLQVMVRGGLLVHGPAYTPFCPAEADYTSDPELELARSSQRWPEPLLSAVYPASPAKLEIWGMPTQRTPPAPAVLRSLGITLHFPDGQQFAATPGWNDTFHQWQRFTPADHPAATAAPRKQGREIFVPDDINHMKTVHASITQTPSPP